MLNHFCSDGGVTKQKIDSVIWEVVPARYYSDWFNEDQTPTRRCKAFCGVLQFTSHAFSKDNYITELNYMFQVFLKYRMKKEIEEKLEVEEEMYSGKEAEEDAEKRKKANLLQSQPKIIAEFKVSCFFI